MAALRLLHTADWHLGHRLHEEVRTREHARFLAWLVDLVESEAVDAVLIAGDVFETANPPADALRSYYRFLAEVRRRVPGVSVVVLAGNHDSATRLEAPGLVLEELGVRVVGRPPRTPEGGIDFEGLVLPLATRDGETAAWLAAVPFLRPSDLPRAESPEEDLLIEGVRRVYGGVLAAARARRLSGQPLVGAGHCYMVGGALSELSERRVLGGNLHALPVDVFPEDVAYVALGHLHKAQRVGGREHVRYSGSPIPLSFAETNYRHQVVLVDLDGEGPARHRIMPVPRTTELLRLPASGPGTAVEALAALRELPNAGDTLRDDWPYLEVRVRLEEPDPGLRKRVDEALEGKAVRLLRLGREVAGAGGHAAGLPPRRLEELSPEQVFDEQWLSTYGGTPSEAIRAAFFEVLAAAEEEAS